MHLAHRTAFLFLLLAPLAHAAQLPAPADYDERALKADCEKYLQSLDPAAFAKDYPKLLKGLLSLDAKTQLETLQKQSSIAELNALPFLIPLLHSPDSEIRVWAGLAIEHTVVSISLKRRDPAVGESVVLKPLTKDDPDLRPLAWMVLQMLKSTDPSLQAQGATMTRYLELRQFKSELTNLLASPHPAVTNTVKETLKSLDLPLPEKK